MDEDVSALKMRGHVEAKITNPSVKSVRDSEEHVLFKKTDPRNVISR